MTFDDIHDCIRSSIRHVSHAPRGLTIHLSLVLLVQTPSVLHKGSHAWVRSSGSRIGKGRRQAKAGRASLAHCGIGGWACAGGRGPLPWRAARHMVQGSCGSACSRLRSVWFGVKVRRYCLLRNWRHGAMLRHPPLQRRSLRCHQMPSLGPPFWPAACDSGVDILCRSTDGCWQ
jgi:hypothetical protein